MEPTAAAECLASTQTPFERSLPQLRDEAPDITCLPADKCWHKNECEAFIFAAVVSGAVFVLLVRGTLKLYYWIRGPKVASGVAASNNNNNNNNNDNNDGQGAGLPPYYGPHGPPVPVNGDIQNALDAAVANMDDQPPAYPAQGGGAGDKFPMAQKNGGEAQDRANQLEQQASDAGAERPEQSEDRGSRSSWEALPSRRSSRLVAGNDVALQSMTPAAQNEGQDSQREEQ